MRIVAELIFICPSADDQSWQQDVFANLVQGYINRLKNTVIRSHGLEVRIVMNSGPHWLSAPGDARREHQKAIEDYKKGIFYNQGDKPSEEDNEEKK